MPGLREITPQEKEVFTKLQENEASLGDISDHEKTSEVLDQREVLWATLTPDSQAQLIARQFLSSFSTPKQLTDWVEKWGLTHGYSAQGDGDGYQIALDHLMKIQEMSHI